MPEDIGPDRILPAEDLTTWKREGATKIRFSQDGFGSRKAISVPTYVRKACEEANNKPAVRFKKDGSWKTWSYTEYYAYIRCTARAMIKLGLEPYHAASIAGFNSPEWFLSCLGAIFAGGFSCGLYPTNSAEMNQFIMNDSSTQILVVEDDAALSKIWKIKDQVPSLKQIIQYSGKPTKPGVLSWQEFMDIGAKASEGPLEDRLRNMAINQCATLIYTSGTTGNPKGVMLSHDNLVYTCDVSLKTCNFRNYQERIVSYLPLSHIAAMLVDIYAPIGCRSVVYFADKDALKGSLVATLQDVRPTQFFGVPRVWEKIMEKMLDKGRDIKGLQKKISQACKEAGLLHYLHNQDTVMYRVGQKVVYKKVRQALGLDQCIGLFSAAAPLGIETIKYFLSLDMPIVELYGMSETTGPHTLSTLTQRRLGSVGKTLESCKSRVSEPSEDGEGEMCMWGRNIMMGYLDREDKTQEDIDPEGWMHSGDLATIDDDGFVFITGRIKELLITAGGENVAPVPIEDLIKRELPIISNAILIGDKKKFLAVFLTIKTEMDHNTDIPKKELAPTSIAWCEALGRKCSTIEDILEGPDPIIMAAIQAGIDRANAHAVSNAARVQRWTILPLDLTISGGELGPTMKLKRFAFNKKFDRAIERLYG
ncbi:hypothetical protein TCAL_01059 [Tigriopus californicus]|uniref:long-chain-fatty-acid--CoA ligase n=1 Tax=Tigriopus californicus TaxID=6832 RepID=A0A553P2B8_TIGCA|nr:long-chain-fatty-acid--CoA ligase ACSBG2-like [Tigriopus californicus]TRY71790.1 hypothetical protein TCAL_01059 [Tigriopus californicus]